MFSVPLPIKSGDMLAEPIDYANTLKALGKSDFFRCVWILQSINKKLSILLKVYLLCCSMGKATLLVFRFT